MSSDALVRETYFEKTPLSASMFADAKKVLGGGNTRMSSYWPPHPLTITHGDGPFMWDKDGNRYIDLVNNYTTLIHGHAHPRITNAIVEATKNGTGWPAYHEKLGALADELVNRIESFDRIRFVNSGTEAGNLALTIARMVTGRWKILMARGGYHGAVIEFMMGSGGLQGQATYIADFNDAEGFTKILRDHGDEIAAVFLEPVMGWGGIIPATDAFIETVREEASRAGALLVFDEVITFRLGRGAYQSNFDVKPDLTMLGKVIGGGLPVGAVGGGEAVMSVFDPENLRVHNAGTFNGNPLTMAAGQVAVEMLEDSDFEKIDRLAARLQDGLYDQAKRLNMPLSVNRVGSLLNIFISEDENPGVINRTDAEQIQLFHLAAMNEGVFLASRGMIAISTVLDEALIDEAVDRLGRALASVKESLVAAA
ncbi:MAG: aminotransferase class III-fold pyridoxal phosphate-dependent enzyme [Pseudomonadota bacterium]